MIWWLLFLVGVFTYFIVQRSVADITRTPVWLLWLVMMAPAAVWAGWAAIKGNESESIPPIVLIGPLVVSTVLYWFLVQLGRRPLSPEALKRQQEMQAALAAAIAPTKVSPLNKDEEAELQNCFPWTVFYLQKIEHRPQALICRGQLRTSPETAYKTIRENIERLFSDRFLVLLQEELNGKPFFALIPNPQARSVEASRSFANAPVTRPFTALFMLGLTVLTTTAAGALWGKDPNTLLRPEDLQSGIPYAASVMGILGIHEIGHYLAARSHKIRSTLPYFLPIPPNLFFFPCGTVGAFMQIRSPIPHRRALFDVGITGPLCGLIAAIPVLLWGFAQSTVVQLAPDAKMGLFNLKAFDPTASLLMMVLSKAALGAQLVVENGKEVALQLHPVAIAGCFGMFMTALALIPIGNFDGGHIVHAMFGQRNGALIGQVSRFLILGLSAVQHELFPLALFLFVMPVVGDPPLNDVSDLDNTRDFLGLLALVLLVMILLPAPRLLIEALL
jgi:membrane-associated protease RseP (regulator of RpoE activity)